MSTAQILVVEDERLVATALQNELEHFGYRVTDIASTAQDAVEKAVTHRPDLVLMDIHLQGDADGIEAARCIHLALRDSRCLSFGLLRSGHGQPRKPNACIWLLAQALRGAGAANHNRNGHRQTPRRAGTGGNTSAGWRRYIMASATR